MAGAGKEINITLKVWRQAGPDKPGKFETYQVKINQSASFLEMLDVVNNNLLKEGKEPIAFEHDCREGICGACGMYINGRAHGPLARTTTCQLHMRSFSDGDTIWVEPFRAKAFPVIKDLVVDRSAFDRIMQAGGYISVNTGEAPDANNILIGKDIADEAFDAATCIGCGACVASCKNASAMLFLSAKVSHLAFLPQGQVEARKRVVNMLNQHDLEGFGNCTNTGACEAECPKGISIKYIAKLNREFLKAKCLLQEYDE